MGWIFGPGPVGPNWGHPIPRDLWSASDTHPIAEIGPFIDDGHLIVDVAIPNCFLRLAWILLMISRMLMRSRFQCLPRPQALFHQGGYFPWSRSSQLWSFCCLGVLWKLQLRLLVPVANVVP